MVVSKDFIRKDISRYNQKWPIRRYWLDGDISVLNSWKRITLKSGIRSNTRFGTSKRKVAETRSKLSSSRKPETAWIPCPGNDELRRSQR